MTGEDLEALTFRHLPKTFLQRVLQAVYLAHRVATDECRSQFPPEEATNVVGFYRRGKLEAYLRDAAKSFPGIEPHTAKADHSNWNHVEIRGGPVVLTEHSVQWPGAVVTHADWRMNLARSNQIRLWGDDLIPDDAPLYVVLLHSPSRWLQAEDALKYGHLPQSCHLAYPSPDFDDYQHMINLFYLFPGIVGAHMPAEWDTEARVRYLHRSRRVASA